LPETKILISSSGDVLEWFFRIEKCCGLIQGLKEKGLEFGLTMKPQ
jgi:hypothetical protein